MRALAVKLGLIESLLPRWGNIVVGWAVTSATVAGVQLSHSWPRPLPKLLHYNTTISSLPCLYCLMRFAERKDCPPWTPYKKLKIINDSYLLTWSENKNSAPFHTTIHARIVNIVYDNFAFKLYLRTAKLVFYVHFHNTFMLTF